MSFFSALGNATRKSFNGMIAARQNRVEGQVYAQLLSLDDEALRTAGFNRTELSAKATNFIQL